MPEKKYDIVGLGVIAVDDMLYVPSYPPANAKMRITERKRQGGGTMSCALAAAGRLGSKTVALGRLGDTDMARFCWEHLPQFGIDMSRILHDPPAGPIYTVIVVAADTGSRAIFGDYTTARPLEPHELKPEWFADAKVLLVDHLNPPCGLEGVRLGKAAGCQVVSDIERNVPELPEIRKYIDHMVCSAEFALPYTGCDNAEEAVRSLSSSGRHATVVVTAGEKGCYWIRAGEKEVHHQPAHKVKAIDTTGCGDVFHGVFCHGVAAGWPMEETIRWATAAAAIKAQRTGGWMAVPTPAEVQEMMKQP